MHYHTVRTDTDVLCHVSATTDVGVAPTFNAAGKLIDCDRRAIGQPRVKMGRVGVIATWSRFSCDNQAHE